MQLNEKQQKKFNIIKKVYKQQKYMYDKKTHSVADKTVSISQPYVRPIVRGKTDANTKFGAKLHISLVDRYARIENLSFYAYNESCNFIDCIERYKERYGHYPEKILADKIYRNRKTLSFCKLKSIRITGLALGRPIKDTKISKKAKREEYKDIFEVVKYSLNK